MLLKPKDAAYQEVINLQQLFWTALKTKDAATFGLVLANDFVARSPDEPDQSREEFIHALTTFPILVAEVNCVNLAIHEFGTTAILTGMQVAKLWLPNDTTAEDHIAITNVYEFSGAAWRMVMTFSVIPTKRTAGVS
jgi:hypothetical protein